MLIAGSGAEALAGVIGQGAEARTVHRRSAPDVATLLRLARAAPASAGRATPAVSEAARRQAAGGGGDRTAMMAFPWHARAQVDEIGLDEADLLAEIHGEAFAHTWSEDEFAALMSHPGAFALGVRREGVFGGRRLVGFVLMRVTADEAEVLTVAVRADSRSRGFGRLLMEEALRRLYRDHVASCFLEVDRGNAAAVGLYRSLGFVVAGERPRYYPEPESGDGTALVMRLQLR